MAKTVETIKAEYCIAKDCKKRDWFGCHEVTIGWYGNERVDYMSVDKKNNIRCFEIKVSKSDFYSKAKNSFCGNYNYYVMPKELYEQVKHDIPPHVGVFMFSVRTFEKQVYSNLYSLKKATKVNIDNTNDMKMYLMRSMARECYKATLSNTDWIGK